MIIPDPKLFRPGSQIQGEKDSWIHIRIKEFKYFNPKKCHSALKNMGLGSEIRDPEKTLSESRIQGSKRLRIPDPEYCDF